MVHANLHAHAQVDKALNDPRKAKTTDAAGKLSKSAGVAAVDRAQTEQSKRLAALMLANLSFKAYFKVGGMSRRSRALSFIV